MTSSKYSRAYEITCIEMVTRHGMNICEVSKIMKVGHRQLFNLIKEYQQIQKKRLSKDSS